MGKVATKKHDTFIDMTAMSDVTVLLLTFFMLTATFKPKEPVEVITPGSISERKIPENDVMTILVDDNGRVFLNLDKPEDKLAVLGKMAAYYQLPELNAQQKTSFRDLASIGVPMNQLSGFLKLPLLDQDEELKKGNGIPLDSGNNQLADWIRFSKEVNENMKFSIKAAEKTPYPLVDKVMKTLVDLKENRYSLQTVLKGISEE